MSPRRINQISLGLLLAGFGGALLIALTAVPPAEDPLLGDPRGNKKYLRELQVIGGKANVLAADFREWFSAQWEGRTLARTVAILTMGAVLLFRFVTLPPPRAGAPAAEGKRPPGPG